MELWNDIANAPYPHWWILTASIGGALVVAAIITAIYNAVRSETRKEADAKRKLSNRAENYAIVAGLLVVVTVASSLFVLSAAQKNHRTHLEDIVANYIYDEYDLIPLTPVKYADGGRGFGQSFDSVKPHGVHATVVQEDGTKADVHVAWDDVNSRPHNPDWELPEGFDPITVTITPRDQDDTDTDVDEKATTDK